ncbi:MAG: hypothetical protein EBT36_05535 [Betaproteobacteria bacterium]|jgi:hypothetical protein|nr:hypothetical protein [Pseudomonadota bacterium]NBO94268.1 hypothetical protein [Betaproteobacteria bacterium]HAB48112.1 hypothetical protein [Lautropia sp.]NBP33881.1 hypothetical protein [Betaproteobacteria bacterium]NBP36816.1 hypothetical protein [Betaproteobacteria bacterium]
MNTPFDAKRHPASQTSRPWSILRQTLADDLALQQPPAWLWWRIRMRLWSIRYQAIGLELGWLYRLTSTTALSTLAFLWVAYSAQMMRSVQPMIIAQSLSHPMAWSAKSLYPQAGKPIEGPRSSALGAESLALLGIPFFGTLQTIDDLSASRQAQWLTNQNGQILALRLAD